MSMAQIMEAGSAQTLDGTPHLAALTEESPEIAVRARIAGVEGNEAAIADRRFLESTGRLQRSCKLALSPKLCP